MVLGSVVCLGSGLTLVYEQTAYRSTKNVIFLACVFLEPVSQGEQNAPSLSETFFFENCSRTRVKGFMAAPYTRYKRNKW